MVFGEVLLNIFRPKSLYALAFVTLLNCVQAKCHINFVYI